MASHRKASCLEGLPSHSRKWFTWHNTLVSYCMCEVTVRKAITLVRTVNSKAAHRVDETQRNGSRARRSRA
eukprot:5880369-Amphidinium_carterae.1